MKSLTQEQIDRIVEICTDPDAAAKALPPEAQREYEEARQSIIDARRSAIENEGRIVIYG